MLWPSVLTALLFGLGTALPLVIGAAVGLRWKLPPRVLAALMAFGAGTLIAAASNELFKPAFDEVGAGLAGAALVGGALIYVVADHLLENRLGPSALGWALLLGVHCRRTGSGHRGGHRPGTEHLPERNRGDPGLRWWRDHRGAGGLLDARGLSQWRLVGRNRNRTRIPGRLHARRLDVQSDVRVRCRRTAPRMSGNR